MCLRQYRYRRVRFPSYSHSTYPWMNSGQGDKPDMPQRDDKVSVDFGRISSATWERLGEFPASTVEKAIPLLVKARSEGRVICSPATLKRGLKDSLSKKLWLMPETAEILNRI